MMAIPVGVTYKIIANRFQRGWSVADLSYHFHCSVRDVEHALRVVLRRQRGKA